MYVDMKYTVAVGLGTDAGSGLLCGTPAVFQPSSTFEPLSGATSQPYGRDQMAALYGRYKVLGFKVALDLNSNTSIGADPGIIQMLHLPPPQTLTLAGANGALSACRPNVTTLFCSTTQRVHYERAFKMHELLGISKAEFDANVEDYAAAVGSNPAQMPLLKLYFALTTAGTTGVTAGAFVTLTQRVQFFARTPQSLS